MRALAEAPVSDWINRSGKLLLFVAGLAALIDVIGPVRFGRWADRAATRRDLVREQMQGLKIGRPLMRLAVRMGHRVTEGHRRQITFSSPWFTAAEFNAFAHRVRTQLMSQGITVSLNNTAKMVMYDAAYEFLSPRLSPEQQQAFRRDGSTFRIARRSWLMSIRVIIGVLLVATPMMFIVPEYGIFVFSASVVLLLLVDFVSFPFLKIVLWAVEMRVRLISIPLVLIGPKKDGWRLRVAALIAFVLGSSLDLIASW